MDDIMDERILREEELSRVSGGVGGKSFAAVAEDFVRSNRCELCPNRNLRFHYGICTEEYNRLLMEWSGSGRADTRCKRRT